MDINVNATLFVQIINFFIAYVLFRFLLFKPAHRIIMQEFQEREEIKALIDEALIIIQEKKKTQYELWQKCHDYYSSHLPPTLYDFTLFHGIIPESTYKRPNHHELGEIIQQESEYLTHFLGAHHGRR